MYSFDDNYAGKIEDDEDMDENVGIDSVDHSDVYDDDGLDDLALEL